MICSSCKKAGELNTEANRANFNSVTAAEVIRVSVRSWHSLCTGCYCQHIVGQVLNHQQVIELKTGKSI